MSLAVRQIDSRIAAALVVEYHYLHRRPPISFAYGLYDGDHFAGVVTFGTPPSRHMQKSVCPSDPGLVLELNRLWVEDAQPANTESWFVARAMALLPPRLVASYADPQFGHAGYIYRALNFYYAGWTDMDRRTPRLDYYSANPNTHSRDAYRNGFAGKRPRTPKIRYWKATGNKTDRKRLEALCGWKKLNWKTTPPPMPNLEV